MKRIKKMQKKILKFVGLKNMKIKKNVHKKIYHMYIVYVFHKILNLIYLQF